MKLRAELPRARDSLPPDVYQRALITHTITTRTYGNYHAMIPLVGDNLAYITLTHTTLTIKYTLSNMRGSITREMWISFRCA